MEDKLKDEVKPLDDVEFKWNIKEEEEGKWVVEPTVCSSVGCVQDDGSKDAEVKDEKFEVKEEKLDEEIVNVAESKAYISNEVCVN